MSEVIRKPSDIFDDTVNTLLRHLQEASNGHRPNEDEIKLLFSELLTSMVANETKILKGSFENKLFAVALAFSDSGNNNIPTLAIRISAMPFCMLYTLDEPDDLNIANFNNILNQCGIDKSGLNEK
jgi:hypothetical protein